MNDADALDIELEKSQLSSILLEDYRMCKISSEASDEMNSENNRH